MTGSAYAHRADWFRISRLRHSGGQAVVELTVVGIRSDRGRIELHLKPVLGKKRANAISRADVERLLNDVKNGRTSAAAPEKRRPGSIATGGAGVAAQCVALASTVLQFAVDRGVRPDNPAPGVKKPAVRKMQRFLSEGELRKLAESRTTRPRVLDAHAIAAIRLLALTGCRRGEIVNLRWRSVDLERRLLFLDDSKTREKVVYLSPPAAEILQTLPRVAGTELSSQARRQASRARLSTRPGIGLEASRA